MHDSKSLGHLVKQTIVFIETISWCNKSHLFVVMGASGLLININIIILHSSSA